LDHDGYLPSFAVVTEGKTSEIKVARTLRFSSGTILAMTWLRGLRVVSGTDAGGSVLRDAMKEKAVYEVKEELQLPQNRT